MRIDKRQNNELRKITFTHNYTKHALGSVLVEFGDTKVLVCANFENAIPKWMEKDSPEGWLSAEYSLLPSSTSTRCQRERTKLSGRTQEIQRLIGRSLRACLDLTKIQGKTFIIDADVIQADGGTRTASICGAYVAVCDMVEKLLKEGLIDKNPIIEPIAAISAGIVNNNVMVDLCYEEDSNAQVDSNIVLTASGKIIEFQTTAEGLPFKKEQLDEIYSIAKESIDKIIKMY
ncbi:ribonuclease PH [bacterium]|nr:ribonuclease PH [bacterium]